jgi:hypothetical protein
VRRVRLSDPLRLLNKLCGRISVIITTNLSFSECANVFGDAKMITVLLDRLTHHATSWNRKRQLPRKGKLSARHLNDEGENEDFSTTADPKHT